MNKELLRVLDKLCVYFNKPIYIVGGAVRNYLMGYPINDIDLAAAITPEEIAQKLLNTEFQVKETSKKLYTLLIIKEDYRFEFTSFRTDSYLHGFHKPINSGLTENILIDAQRRDFTVNAIYYDIKRREIVDPLFGCEDINKRHIRTVVQPQEVFSQDGLRLMRLARLSAETGMGIENHTFLAARENAFLINDIAAERIKEEFNRIIYADNKYGVDKAHVKGLLCLDKLNILDIILPELIRCKGVKQRADYHKYDVFGHILKAYEMAPKEVRLAALFHDIAKPLCIQPNGSMKGHDKKGAELTKEIMGRLRYSKQEIEETVRLVSLHMYDLKCQAKECAIREFILENHDIVQKVIALKKADYSASGILEGKCNCAERIEKVLYQMQSEGVPFTLKELKVDGKDLIELNVPESKRGIALNSLLKAVVCNKAMMGRDAQLSYLKNNQNDF